MPDGYVAEPQGPDDPLGDSGLLLHGWITHTRTLKEMYGETGLDNDRAEERRQDFRATIVGRNVFGPIRGD
jgi:hypothetical protein